MLRPTIGRRALLKIGSLPLILLIVSVGACQTYNFEPFTPSFYKQYVQVVNGYKITVKPNVMIAFDKSGSMNDSVGGGKTKIEEARTAMVSFMNDAGTLARFGLTFYPDVQVDSQCGAPNKAIVPFPTVGTNIGGLPSDENTDAGLKANADAISTAIKDVTPGGGTPTESTFKFLEGYEGLSGADLRTRYILLVTDGLPNCNPTNPNNVCNYATENWRNVYSNPPPTSETDSTKIAAFNEVRAALEKCDCQSGAPSTCLYPATCSSGCLNLTATAAQISRLRTKAVKTIVVGFGTGASASQDAGTVGSTAYNALSAMARAGGFPRACLTGDNAECGADDTCDIQTKVCKRPFYQVSSGDELAKTLSDIISALPKPCEFQLVAQPTDSSTLAVIVNGTVIPPGTDTWKLYAGKVIFEDNSKVCMEINTATNVQPVKIEFRILQQVK